MINSIAPRNLVAEIIFDEPAGVRSAIAALTAVGLDAEILPWIDDGGTNTVWVLARADSELDNCAFSDWVDDLVYRFGGEVMAAGTEIEIDLERKHRDNERVGDV